jgi:hypothetical protein
MSTPLDEKDVVNDTRVVDIVRVVVHTFGLISETSSQSHNHWSIYLVLANNEGSIRMNMRAKEAQYSNGVLKWSEQSYTMSNSAIRVWDFRCVAGITVCHISRLVYQMGRQKYDMSVGGSGCRFWV